MEHTHRIETKEDLSQPIIVSPPVAKLAHMQEADDSFNAYLLRQRESHGKRTTIRVNFEVYTRKSAKTLSFSRLRNRHLLVSCSNADQAQLVMSTIEQVCKAMHGKYLAKAPDIK